MVSFPVLVTSGPVQMYSIQTVGTAGAVPTYIHTGMA